MGLSGMFCFLFILFMVASFGSRWNLLSYRIGYTNYLKKLWHTLLHISCMIIQLKTKSSRSNNSKLDLTSVLKHHIVNILVPNIVTKEKSLQARSIWQENCPSKISAITSSMIKFMTLISRTCSSSRTRNSLSAWWEKWAVQLGSNICLPWWGRTNRFWSRWADFIEWSNLHVLGM